MTGAGADGAQRKTIPLPSVLGTVRPPNALLPKGTPANLRQFAESPVPRRAINSSRIGSRGWTGRSDCGAATPWPMFPMRNGRNPSPDYGGAE